MLPVLQFIFSSFWVFCGTVILLGIAVQGLAAVCASFASLVRGAR